ncbi:alpha-1,2-fucosyltransferase [Microbacterium sp. HD4P20]|uniref:alpha-1,2-fucosyltransferase n=1 Tax=Microbacterium sp. HD4P20 TaxID=2864874 RepID=UPI001C63C015|nr:alpha-1,2-fucosyltransferase [Microbacterium sp. HD4P20]MCP2637518.1 alpha-1,2-fucosyltransferase [Microbacterium sp. HD4P20]
MAPVRDISDGICAYLQGGFGNQLFILAAGWAQADRLGCPLYVDASRFLADDWLERAKETPREYELASIDFPGILLREDSPWFRNSPRRPAVIRRPGRRSTTLRVYRQPTINYHHDINRVTPGTTLLGYFQSWRYFDPVADRLADALLSAPLSDAESGTLRSFERTPAITAHLRRGDYLTPEAARHHGIASADYFVRALALLRTLATPTVSVRAFSDSPDLVRRELADVENLELVDDVTSLGSIATVRAMSAGVGLAMSNSSFSWWAAWLMSRRDPVAPVIAPRPWQADGQSGHDQLLPHWLTLDAR